MLKGERLVAINGERIGLSESITSVSTKIRSYLQGNGASPKLRLRFCGNLFMGNSRINRTQTLDILDVRQCVRYAQWMKAMQSNISTWQIWLKHMYALKLECELTTKNTRAENRKLKDENENLKAEIQKLKKMKHKGNHKRKVEVDPSLQVSDELYDKLPRSLETLPGNATLTPVRSDDPIFDGDQRAVYVLYDKWWLGRVVRQSSKYLHVHFPENSIAKLPSNQMKKSVRLVRDPQKIIESMD